MSYADGVNAYINYSETHNTLPLLFKLLGVGDRVKFIKADINGLEFTEGKFDLVVSNLVFHNLGKKRFSAYSEIYKILKPGGYFALGDFLSGVV